MKQFEDCNLIERGLRYRFFLLIPFSMFKMIRHWQRLEIPPDLESCYHASISLVYVRMRYFRKLKI